ncbi:hypothetical protein HB904_03850 [Listeria booriae]|uniref:Uncharacterized protein n=1 Tax=Listeria booriae TaxID=1552123 RepID=A0A842AGA9_9LIST|nr:hypothetical protein [Listeria booriae]MBC1615305.1 hypothetical protein [Listeria booriae]
MEIEFKDANGKIVNKYKKTRGTTRDWLEGTMFQAKQEERAKRRNKMMLKLNSQVDEVAEIELGKDEDNEVLDVINELERIDSSFFIKDTQESLRDGMAFLVKVYGKQFTEDEAYDGLTPEEYTDALNTALTFALNGGEAKGDEKKEQSISAKQLEESN